jgi:L-2-hydroxyglutarate oxidase LhgO
MINGADVNYGALTKNLLDHLRKQERFAVHFSQQVTGWRAGRTAAGGSTSRTRPQAPGAASTRATSSSAPAARR